VYEVGKADRPGATTDVVVVGSGARRAEVLAMLGRGDG
jgi:hypothetical protein